MQHGNLVTVLRNSPSHVMTNDVQYNILAKIADACYYLTSHNIIHRVCVYYKVGVYLSIRFRFYTHDYDDILTKEHCIFLYIFEQRHTQEKLDFFSVFILLYIVSFKFTARILQLETSLWVGS